MMTLHQASANNKTGFCLEHLSISYGSNTIVHDVSVDLPKGLVLAIVGPSGCGKSSLLKAVTGLIRPSAGRIMLNGKDLTAVPPRKRGLGYVPQDYALFPNLDVLGNVGYGLRARSIGSRLRREKAMEMLDFVQLADYAHRKPSQLSGGQRQRVALARALAISPDALLLDEPLSALDPQLRTTMRQQLHDLLSKVGCTTVIVTHDRREALALGNRIAVLRSGHVEQYGTPEELWKRPGNGFVANFLDNATLLPAKVRSDEVTVDLGAGQQWVLPLSDTSRTHSNIDTEHVHGVLIHEDTLAISPDPSNGVSAELIRTEYLGDHVLATILIGTTSLSMQLTSDPPLGGHLLVVPKRGKLTLV